MADNAAPLILLTRPRAQSERFAAALAGLAEIRIIPLQAIVPTGDLPQLDGVNGLIFTSENGVRVFAEQSDRRDLPAWCVGAQTARTAQAFGLSARTGGGSSEALIAEIAGEGTGGPLLHLHGEHVRGDIARRLTEHGVPTSSAAIYDQQAIPPEEPIAALALNRMTYAPLFSPRSAELLAAEIGDAPGDWRFPCLSGAVRDALPERLRQVASVAGESTGQAMVSLLRNTIYL